MRIALSQPMERDKPLTLGESSPALGDPRLQLLADITDKLTLGASFEELFDLIYERLREFIPYNRISIVLIDEARERLSILAARSDGRMILDRGYSASIRGSSLEGLLRDGRIRIINDLQGYLAHKPESESTRLMVKEGMRSSLTLPLLFQGRPRGFMFFSSRDVETYRREHEEFLRSIVGHVGIAIERTRLLDELREKTEYLGNILHNSADAIIVADTRNCIMTWNDGAKTIFGYDESEVLGKNCAMLLPPEDREQGKATQIRRLVEERGILRDHQCVFVTRDGRRLVADVTSTLLKDKKGRPVGRSSIIRDVTGLRQLQEQLIRAQSLAALGEMAATVAHEIKNPLAGISGAIQVLADAIPASDARKAVVGEILGQIDRLDATVRDLLTFARPMTPVRSEVRLRESLARAWTLLARQPGGSKIRFDLAGVPETLSVTGDAQLLHQVWINLLQNAVEAMGDGGDLVVTAREGEKVSIEIGDTGSGVAAQNVDKLFRPFFSTKTRGTGLGLAISRKIIDAHGGTIRLASRAPHGAVACVEIPR